MRAKISPGLDMVLIESGGDNSSPRRFPPETGGSDDLRPSTSRAGDKIPSKGGPGITRSDLLVINKIDLAPAMSAASLEKNGCRREKDARRAALCHDQPEEERGAGSQSSSSSRSRVGSTGRRSRRQSRRRLNDVNRVNDCGVENISTDCPEPN